MNPLALLTFLFLSGAMVLAVLRLIKGPSLPDRVMSLDLFGLVIAGCIVGTAVFFNLAPLLDVILVFALLVFFGTVALARYLEKRFFDND
jgi:multicomponent Na+:H+ antiporter subunit F